MFKKLVVVALSVRTADILNAYRSLHVGRDRIKWFGPAFFSKWLYFCGYAAQSTDNRRPLILDARVARALGWSQRWGWSANTYETYLTLCSEIKDQWCPDDSVHVVEYSLFTSSRPNF